MHEYFKIKEAALPIITSAGYAEESENYSPDEYGSIHTIFSKGEEKLRLIWDGKDGCGLAQILEGEVWVDLPSYVPESPEKKFIENINKLCDKLKTALSTT